MVGGKLVRWPVQRRSDCARRQLLVEVEWENGGGTTRKGMGSFTLISQSRVLSTLYLSTGGRAGVGLSHSAPSMPSDTKPDCWGKQEPFF